MKKAISIFEYICVTIYSFFDCLYFLTLMGVQINLSIAISEKELTLSSIIYLVLLVFGAILSDGLKYIMYKTNKKVFRSILVRMVVIDICLSLVYFGFSSVFSVLNSLTNNWTDFIAFLITIIVLLVFILPILICFRCVIKTKGIKWIVIIFVVYLSFTFMSVFFEFWFLMTNMSFILALIFSVILVLLNFAIIFYLMHKKLKCSSDILMLLMTAFILRVIYAIIITISLSDIRYIIFTFCMSIPYIVCILDYCFALLVRSKAALKDKKNTRDG